MKRRRRDEAEAKMAQMIRLAVAAGDAPVAATYAKIAWRMATRHRLRMPYQMRMMFCKKCKEFIPPGRGSRVRLGSAPRGVRVTCGYCGHTYRKVLGRGGRRAGERRERI